MGEHKTWLYFNPGHAALTEDIADIAINDQIQNLLCLNWFSWKGHGIQTRHSFNTQRISRGAYVAQSVLLTLTNPYQVGENTETSSSPVVNIYK